MVDTYHEVKDKHALLTALNRALKPSGRLAVVDRYSYGCWDEREDHQAVSSEAIRRARRAGFELEETHDFLPFQFFLILSPSKSAFSRR